MLLPHHEGTGEAKLEWKTRNDFPKFEAHVDAVLNHEPSASGQAKKADPLCRLTWTKLQSCKTHNAFFDAAIASCKKHFLKQKEAGVLSHAFAGDSEPAHALAKWVVDCTLPLPISELHASMTLSRGLTRAWFVLTRGGGQRLWWQRQVHGHQRCC